MQLREKRTVRNEAGKVSESDGSGPFPYFFSSLKKKKKVMAGYSVFDTMVREFLSEDAI